MPRSRSELAERAQSWRWATLLRICPSPTPPPTHPAQSHACPRAPGAGCNQHRSSVNYGTQGINRLGKAPPRPGSLRAPDRNRNLTLVQYSGKDEEDILKDKDYQRTVRDVRASALLLCRVMFVCSRSVTQHSRAPVDAVQIEDASQQQGWLFSRGGAFLLLHHDVTVPRVPCGEVQCSGLVRRCKMSICSLTADRLLRLGFAAFDKTDLLYLRDQEEKSRHTEMELHDREVTTYAELRAKAERERRTDMKGLQPPPRRDKPKCGHHCSKVSATCTLSRSISTLAAHESHARTDKESNR